MSAPVVRRIAGALLAVAVASAPPAEGQQVPGLSLDSLLTPASPAFTLMGVSPVAIERPTTPKALAALVAAAVKEGDGIPRNAALEISPYWLVSHPELTFERYYRPRLGERLLHTLSLSVATSGLTGVGGDEVPGSAVGIGFRTSPIAGKPLPELAAMAAELRELQVQFDREVDPELTDEEIDRLWDEKFDTTARRLALGIQSLDKERIGFLLDAAGALVVDFPSDAADSGTVSRAGFWLTPAYHPAGGALELLGVLRYVLDRRSGVDRHTIDFGVRTILETGQLAGSLEFIEHTGDDYPLGEAPGYRLAGNLEYRVGASSALSLTVGRDDFLAADGSDELIAQLSVNLGFGPVPLLRLGP